MMTLSQSLDRYCSNHLCNNCPVASMCKSGYCPDIAEFFTEVMKWAQENSSKSFKDVLLEKFPNANIAALCPNMLFNVDSSYTGCDKDEACEECWNKTYREKNEEQQDNNEVKNMKCEACGGTNAHLFTSAGVTSVRCDDCGADLMPGMNLKVNDLLPCPFCGSTTAPTCMTSREIRHEEIINWRRSPDNYAVVCSVHKLGCGGAGGYAQTQAEAIDKWNYRTHK